MEGKPRAGDKDLHTPAAQVPAGQHPHVPRHGGDSLGGSAAGQSCGISNGRASG